MILNIFVVVDASLSKQPVTHRPEDDDHDDAEGENDRALR